MSERIELLYAESCPHVEGARAALREALRRVGHVSGWREWERNDADAPEHARLYGSPTILVDGRDIVGVRPSEASATCRAYDGVQAGVPPVDAIVSALVAGESKNARRGWSRALAILPGAGLTLLPVGVCPACWPAYAGLLGSLGLGFLLESEYLLPLMGVFLAMALGTLGYRARSRRGYGPLALGAVATATALLGKFALSSDALLYLGMALLVGASLWNTWPRKAARAGTCGKCAAQAPGPNRTGAHN